MQKVHSIMEVLTLGGIVLVLFGHNWNRFSARIYPDGWKQALNTGTKEYIEINSFAVRRVPIDKRKWNSCLMLYGYSYGLKSFSSSCISDGGNKESDFWRKVAEDSVFFMYSRYLNPKRAYYECRNPVFFSENIDYGASLLGVCPFSTQTLRASCKN